MKDQGFILTCYIVTFLSTGGLAAWVLRRGSALARQIPDEDKPWT